MCTPVTEIIHGIPFVSRYGCYQTSLPLVNLLLDYKSGGYAAYVNNSPICQKDKIALFASVEEAAAAAIAEARNLATKLLEALQTSPLPENAGE